MKAVLLEPLNAESLSNAPGKTAIKDQKNDSLAKEIFKKLPRNTKIEEITAKILLIDMIYSTNLRFRFNADFSLSDLANGIAEIEHFDMWLEEGNDQAIDAILKLSDESNLFSFASKYCFAHNYYSYGKDAFSIYDSSVEELLPKYAKCTRTQLEAWRKNREYSSFNQFVTDYLKSTGIQTEHIKLKFDRFLWNQRKENKS